MRLPYVKVKRPQAHRYRTSCDVLVNELRYYCAVHACYHSDDRMNRTILDGDSLHLRIIMLVG
jgi:hypothetical protein